MPIPLATNFEVNSNLAIDGYTVKTSMAALLASPWRKEGVPVYVKDEKAYYYWDGTAYIKQAMQSGMPVAPTGAVYGAAGNSWYELENIEKRAVIVNQETVTFTEANNVITIDPADLAAKDDFTIIYNGAVVVFYKNHSAVNSLSAIGTDKKLYQFTADWTAGTITITELLDLVNIPSDIGSVCATPDYAKISGPNIIQPNNTWTAANDGYVKIVARTNTDQRIYFSINGIPIYSCYATANVPEYHTFPIMQGDTIAFGVPDSNLLETWFIPLRYANIRTDAVDLTQLSQSIQDLDDTLRQENG